MSLLSGTPAPVFTAPSPINPNFAFGSLGGRWIVMAFLPPPGPARDEAIALVQANADLFGRHEHVFFGVVDDRETYAGLQNDGLFRWFADFEGELRRLYLATGENGELEPQWVIIDPSMRILGSFGLSDGARMINALRAQNPPDLHAGVPMHAPVLIVPRIFEPRFCRELIDYYHAIGGERSGVMREIDGRTVGVLDGMKSRRDVTLQDNRLIEGVRWRVGRRLTPEIQKAFCFAATRIERYLVARYDAEEGGYFRPHRDNTTAGTAHRRFAVSINLNSEEFEGGDLRFPEFGSRTYRPPTGGAVVFSCSLLHEATPVTGGTRFACLPFLYDDAAAEIRERNAHLLGAAPAEPASADEPAREPAVPAQ